MLDTIIAADQNLTHSAEGAGGWMGQAQDFHLGDLCGTYCDIVDLLFLDLPVVHLFIPFPPFFICSFLVRFRKRSGLGFHNTNHVLERLNKDAAELQDYPFSTHASLKDDCSSMSEQYNTPYSTHVNACALFCCLLLCASLICSWRDITALRLVDSNDGPAATKLTTRAR